jgi:ABC-2 type transport system permease protein
MLKKDLILYFRNPLYALVTVLGLVAYTAMYWALPATVNDDVPSRFIMRVIKPVSPAFLLMG